MHFILTETEGESTLKIGLLDSGMGGLNVLQQAMQQLPEEDYIYYADTDHVPYGTKTKDEIIGYVDEAVTFLVERGVKAIVIACNTATSVAIEYIRKKYPLPVLGMEPAVKPAVRICQTGRVMIAATPLTIKEEKLKNLLEQVDGEHRTDLLPLPELVLFAEAGNFTGKAVDHYLRGELARYDMSEYSTFVLGCTHFNYFKEALRGIIPEQVEFIDGINGTIKHLKDILQRMELLGGGSSQVEYYITGRLVTEKRRLAMFEQLLQRAGEMQAY